MQLRPSSNITVTCTNRVATIHAFETRLTIGLNAFVTIIKL